jgi:hypothetical protein
VEAAASRYAAACRRQYRRSRRRKHAAVLPNFLGSEAASHSALRLSLIMAGCTSSGTLYSEEISF